MGRDVIALCVFSMVLLQGTEPTALGDDVTAEPESDLGSDIQLHLYTRAHPITLQLMINDSADGTDFSPSRPTVVVVHGFTGSGFVQSVTLVRDAFLYSEDVQVVVVHWEQLAQGPDYDVAANNTAVVARRLAAALDRMDNLHLVGFSLGAQVVGLAGSLMTRRPDRITALDPARPHFEKKGSADRLDPTDADFVLVLHTSGGFVSFQEPQGHVDFYPNGGMSPQPHCEAELLKLVCSHLIAPVYFMESIYRPEAFPAVRCGSWQDFEAGFCQSAEQVFLGPHTPNTTRGSFYLRTNAMEPYGQGEVNAITDNSLSADDHRSGRQHDPTSTTEKVIVFVDNGAGSVTQHMWILGVVICVWANMFKG